MLEVVDLRAKATSRPKFAIIINTGSELAANMETTFKLEQLTGSMKDYFDAAVDGM